MQHTSRFALLLYPPDTTKLSLRISNNVLILASFVSVSIGLEFSNHNLTSDLKVPTHVYAISIDRL